MASQNKGGLEGNSHSNPDGGNEYSHQTQKPASSKEAGISSGGFSDEHHRTLADRLGGHEEPSQSQEQYQAQNQKADGQGTSKDPPGDDQDGISVACGPLLRYYKTTSPTNNPVWHGSVLIITGPWGPTPCLSLMFGGTVGTDRSLARLENQYDIATRDPLFGDGRQYSPVKLLEDMNRTFWRFDIEVPLQSQDSCWQYKLPGTRLPQKTRRIFQFYTPAVNESMRIMFHSCNGFSVGTDQDAWSGPALWNDVLRKHQQQPIHVMIGGGDQIYNDGVRVQGPLNEWANHVSPEHRHQYPFDERLRDKCDDFYVGNYINWYSTEPFAAANSQIAQINIWDDHDIIDGFGSYTDHFMSSPVFRGVGGVAHKYYLLFQHHTAPPRSTYTTDAPQTTVTNGEAPGIGPVQARREHVLQEPVDSSWILGAKPGPYISQLSRNLYCQLGQEIVFVGFDARSERTRHQINCPETYDLIFDRLHDELTSLKGSIKHLIVLLGVPIAYPRLVWLENIITSPVLGPIRFLNKRFGWAGSLFNHFDGQVDILDDLDDHYAARVHKVERKALILRLQALAQQFSVRITILGGDVHLAAVGRFYSNPKLGLDVERDHRYIANVISSAITNKPPPPAIANFLNRRNKIHHLDQSTDETLMDLFDKGGRTGKRTVASNKATMPSRNYALITHRRPARREQNPTNGVGTNSALVNGTSSNGKATNGTVTNGKVVNGTTTNGNASNGTALTPTPSDLGTDGTFLSKLPPSPPSGYQKFVGTDGHKPLGPGEQGAGTQHRAASGLSSPADQASDSGALDVSIRVEIDQHDPAGETEGYGFSIPALEALPVPEAAAAAASRRASRAGTGFTGRSKVNGVNGNANGNRNGNGVGIANGKGPTAKRARC